MAIRERIPFKQCPLCGSKEWEPIRKVEILLGPLVGMTFERKLQWCECTDCKHVFAEGYWPDESMAKILEYMPPMSLDMQEERRAWAGIVEKILHQHVLIMAFDKTAKAAVSDPMRWLDVGCGHGVGLSVAEEYGFEVLGVDMRQWSVDTLKGWGYPVEQALFEEFVESAKHNSQKWDVIVMAEFLEHCPFPVDTLKKAKALLRPGGVLYASVPSRDSLMWRAKDVMVAGGPRVALPPGTDPEIGWQQIEHCHVFGRKQFEDVFRRAGLEPVAFHVGARYFETIEVIGR